MEQQEQTKEIRNNENEREKEGEWLAWRGGMLSVELQVCPPVFCLVQQTSRKPIKDHQQPQHLNRGHFNGTFFFFCHTVKSLFIHVCDKIYLKSQLRQIIASASLYLPLIITNAF